MNPQIMSCLGKGDLEHRVQFNTIYWHLQPSSKMMIGTSQLNSKWIPIEKKMGKEWVIGRRCWKRTQ
jgi:hypothetical protein